MLGIQKTVAHSYNKLFFYSIYTCRQASGIRKKHIYSQGCDHDREVLSRSVNIRRYFFNLKKRHRDYRNYNRIERGEVFNILKGGRDFVR